MCITGRFNLLPLTCIDENKLVDGEGVDGQLL